MDFQELENIVSAMTVRLKEKSEEAVKEKIKQIESEYDCKIVSVNHNPKISSIDRSMDSFMVMKGYFVSRFELKSNTGMVFGCKVDIPMTDFTGGFSSSLPLKNLELPNQFKMDSSKLDKLSSEVSLELEQAEESYAKHLKYNGIDIVGSYTKSFSSDDNAINITKLLVDRNGGQYTFHFCKPKKKKK